MGPSRTHHSRLIDWTGAKNGEAALKRHVVQFVKGMRGPRVVPVTGRDIKRWFYVTPAAAVDAAINAALDEGLIEIRARSLTSRRRAKGVCVYIPAAA